MAERHDLMVTGDEDLIATTTQASHQTLCTETPKGEHELSEQERALTRSEAGRLAELEQVVERGQQTFVEVGQALLEIRDSRLYRETYNNFPEYCRARWDIDASYANYRIRAAEAATIVADGSLPPLGNEYQARQLARAPEDQRAEIWERVQDQAERVTAKVIRAEVDRTLGVTSPVKDVTPVYEATTSTGRQVTIRVEPLVSYMRALDSIIRAAERASSELPPVESRLSDLEKDAALVKLRAAIRALDPGRDDRIYKRVAVVGERKTVNR